MLEVFRSHFHTLYNLDKTTPPTSTLTHKIETYLQSHVKRKLSIANRQLIEAPITDEELRMAITDTPTGKAPGPDGLSLLYYKKLLETLIPQWLSAFNSLTQGGCLHPATLTATVTLLPKPGKDLDQCSDYRPISLLNQDVKLFAKVLATRLKPFIPGLVHADQTGFIPGREAKDSTVRAVNLIHGSPRLTTAPFLLLSTDCDKAFDRVRWDFLFRTLSHMGLGENMILWIRALYTHPSARINVNGVLSDSFPISNGTRQGCPLSPLLFALSLEPFLQAVRDAPDIAGLWVGNTEHRLAAYADDLLFFVRSPKVTLPTLLRMFADYGTLSNLKLNMDKSEIMPVLIPPKEALALQSSFPFKWCQGQLKYLGTFLTPDTNDLYRANFQPLLASLELDLRRWSLPHISWFGRINTIKMSVLPRILYLFQTLPISLPRLFFKRLNSMFRTFVWNGKAPRVKLNLLTTPRSMGGMSMPHIWHYYCATHMQRLVEWGKNTSPKLWVGIEKRFAGDNLAVLPWMPRNLASPLHYALPTTLATLSVWRSLQTKLPVAPYPSPLMPLQHLPVFSRHLIPTAPTADPPSPLPRHFLTAGAQVAEDQLPYSRPLGFLGKFHLHRLISYLGSLAPLDKYCRPLTIFETISHRGTTPPHSISLFYGLLQSLSTPPTQFCGKWEASFRITLKDEDWSKIYTLAHCCTPSTRIQEVNYKILYRWYRTPDRLSHFSGGGGDLCWRCSAPHADHLHIWWSCPKVQLFWERIHEYVCKLVEPSPPFTPEFYLLHHTSCSISGYKKSIIPCLLHAARLTIPRFWKQDITPPLSVWFDEMECIRGVDELTFRARD
uniref:Reverse transcriptase domain-containing protein n=1 Tax=Leptobrachium leishanense TaxID=445787 RepID=A0A8C5QG16_9ANUR